MGYLDSTGLRQQIQYIKSFVQTKLADYLPKSGGTMTGDITYDGLTNDVFHIGRTEGDGSRDIGWFNGNNGDGANIALRSAEFTGAGDAGEFILIAKSSSAYKALVGKPDGTFTWNGKNIAWDVKSGSANGTISVNGSNVSVYGLGSAAYTDSTAYAAASHTHSYLATSGGTVSGTLTLSRTTAASASADNKPALIVGGASTAAHLELDANDIMAKATGTTTAALNVNTGGGSVNIGNSTYGVAINSSNSIYPRTTNKASCGHSSYLWTTVYAKTSTINTSDARQKQNIDDIDDAVLDAWGDIRWQQYKLKDSVEEKGAANARNHTGIIAQNVDEIFRAKGLDPRAYGFFCYDEWGAEEAEYTAGGELVREAREAGDAYAVRYEEALVIEAAYQRRRADRLEARISELEERMTALEK